MLHVHKTVFCQWLFTHGDQSGSANQCRMPGVTQ